MRERGRLQCGLTPYGETGHIAPGGVGTQLKQLPTDPECLPKNLCLKNEKIFTFLFYKPCLLKYTTSILYSFPSVQLAFQNTRCHHAWAWATHKDPVPGSRSKPLRYGHLGSFLSHGMTKQWIKIICPSPVGSWRGTEEPEAGTAGCELTWTGDSLAQREKRH